MKLTYVIRALLAGLLLAASLAAVLYLERGRIFGEEPQAHYEIGQLLNTQQANRYRPVGFDAPPGLYGFDLLKTLPGGLVHRMRSMPAPGFGHSAPDSRTRVIQIVRRGECLKINDVKLVWPKDQQSAGRIESIASPNPPALPCEAQTLGATCVGVSVWLQGHRAHCTKEEAKDDLQLLSAAAEPKRP